LRRPGSARDAALVRCFSCKHPKKTIRQPTQSA
jgi:hypothetical protein